MKIARGGFYFSSNCKQERKYIVQKTSELIFEKITPENINEYLGLMDFIRYIETAKEKTRIFLRKEKV